MCQCCRYKVPSNRGRAIRLGRWMLLRAPDPLVVPVLRVRRVWRLCITKRDYSHVLVRGERWARGK
jgi:hypothetical protein